MSKVYFKNITVQNFMSFGNDEQTIPLNTDDVSLILGDNRDEGEPGLSRNGAGKSCIFQALFWCLFDTGIAQIKANDFINFTNGKKLMVRLELTVDGKDFTIIRTRKPTGVELLLGDETYTLHSTATTDENIRELIGTTPEAFLNTNVLDANVVPYMATKGAEQRNFMEDFLDMNLLSERAETVKSDAKDNAIELKLEEQRLENVRRTNERLEANIKALQEKAEQFEVNAKAKRENAEKELAELRQIDIEAQKETHAQIAKLESLIIDNDSMISKIEKEITSIQHKLDSIKSAEESLAQAQSQIDEWETENSVSIQKIEAELAELQKTDTKLVFEAYELVDEYNHGIAEYERKIQNTKDTIARHKKDAESMKSELAALESGKCPYCEQPHFDENKQQTIKNDIEIALDSISDCESTIEMDQKEYERLQNDLKGVFDDMKGLPSLEEAKKIDLKVYNVKIRLNHEKSVENPYKQQIATAKAKLEQLGDKDELEKELQKNVDDGEILISRNDKNEEVLKELYGPDLLPKDRLAVIEHQIESLEKSLQESQQNPYIEQIDTLQIQIDEVSEDKLNDLKKRDSHYKVLIKLLTDSKSFVRKNLIDQYVPYINGRLVYYLDKIQSMLVAKINSDLTVDIEYMNHNVSYGNLSKGERLRLNFATSMALMDMNQMLGKSFNFIAVDEFMDSGSDAWFFHTAFDIIKSQGKTVMVISHRDELLEMVDKIIKVTKERGFSTVEIQEKV